MMPTLRNFTSETDLPLELLNSQNSSSEHLQVSIPDVDSPPHASPLPPVPRSEPRRDPGRRAPLHTPTVHPPANPAGLGAHPGCSRLSPSAGHAAPAYTRHPPGSPHLRGPGCPGACGSPQGEGHSSPRSGPRQPCRGPAHRSVAAPRSRSAVPASATPSVLAPPYSFPTFTAGTYCMPGAVPGAGNSAVSHTQASPSASSQSTGPAARRQGAGRHGFWPPFRL